MLLGACDRTPSVVIYVSADEQVARPILEAFEEKTGVRVDAKYDTEATKTTGLVSTLLAEQDRPRADVFWSSEVFRTIELADEGVLAPLEAPALRDWPAPWRDDEGRWYGFAPRARVIVYAPDRVAADEVPTAWTDLTRDWWRDRLVMADPRFGTTGGHLASMKAYWNREFMPGFYEAWLEGLAENRVRLLTTGNAGVVDAVVNGEADAGLTDTDDVWAALARGARLEWVYPLHDRDAANGGGTLLIPNTVAVVDGAPNPDAARQLAEFLLSDEVAAMLLRSTSRNLPLHPDRLEPEDRALAEAHAVPDPLRIHYPTAARAMPSAIDAAMRRLDD